MTLRHVLDLMMRIPFIVHPRDVVTEIDTYFRPGNADVQRTFDTASATLPENIRPYLFYAATEFWDRSWQHVFLVNSKAPDHSDEVAKCYMLPCSIPFEKFPTVNLSVAYKTRDGYVRQTARVIPRTGRVYIGAAITESMLSDESAEIGYKVRDMNAIWLETL